MNAQTTTALIAASIFNSMDRVEQAYTLIMSGACRDRDSLCEVLGINRRNLSSVFLRLRQRIGMRVMTNRNNRFYLEAVSA